MSANVASFPALPGALVNKQLSAREIEVTNAQTLPLGTWLLCARHVGIVRSHRHGKAVVDLVYERTADGWGDVRTAALLGHAVEPLTAAIWEELFSSQFAGAVHVGEVRQEHVDCPARLPLFGRQHMLVVGQTGSGKSTVLVSAVVNARNDLDARKVPQAHRPSVVIFDAHGDFVGRVREEHSDKRRPNLVDCLKEEPVIFRAGDLRCLVRDIPPPLLMKALGPLSAAQQRWCALYAASDDDHTGIEHLIFDKHEPQWGELFPDLAVNGELQQQTRESLKVMRAKVRALTREPLFNKNTSTWREFFAHVYAGRVVVVDVASYPAPQQPLLVVLVLLMVERQQAHAQLRGEKLTNITVIADELHKFAGAYDRLSALAREGRKFAIGSVLGSQRLADFPADVLTQVRAAVVLCNQGPDATAVLKRWPELRAVASEIPRLRPGEGFFVTQNTPWPIRFREPAPVPEARGRTDAHASRKAQER